VVADANGERADLPRESAILAFFKTTCPTCELTWPYLERLRRASEGSGLSFVAVSQDSPAWSDDFQKRLGTHLVTVYDPEPWRASEAAGLETVPTLFFVGPGGRVEEIIVGFQRAGLESFAARASALGGQKGPLFTPSDTAPGVKPG
jgi:hypothetical protein